MIRITPEEYTAQVRIWNEGQAKQQAMVAALVATTVPKPGGPGVAWTLPTSASNAWALNAITTHKGKTWESLVDFNVWEPGVSGWREKVATGYPPWLQPTGQHDAYSFGDKVSHTGKNYRNDHPGQKTNVWIPGQFSGWVVIP